VSAGPSESIEKRRSLFAAMGQKTFMMNEDAAGANLIKLSGNFLTTSVIESLAECFADAAGQRRSTKVPGSAHQLLILGSGIQDVRSDDRCRKI